MKTTVATATSPQLPKSTLLRANGVTLSVGGRVILNDVNIRVDAGEIVGLLGPHGAGKTTFLSVIAGRTRPATGSVWIGMRDVTRLSPKARQDLGLAVCHQLARRFFRRISLLDTLAEAVQRDAQIICLDEPYQGIAPHSLAHNVISALIATAKDCGRGLLLIDHNVREALGLVDRAYLMYEGRILREGSTDFLKGGSQPPAAG